MLTRYQVKKKGQDWLARGPDLLRTEGNAAVALRKLMKKGAGWHVRRVLPSGTTDWEGPKTRTQVIKSFNAWEPYKDGVTFQAGRKNKEGRIEPLVVARSRKIEVEERYNATDRAEIACALMLEAPVAGITFSGLFVCKQIAGSSSWSMHAWGDAVDISYNTAELFEWCHRMAKEGLLPSEQLIGTVDGKQEVETRPEWGWAVRPVNAGGSHTWHVHNTVRFHVGRPPCA